MALNCNNQVVSDEKFCKGYVGLSFGRSACQLIYNEANEDVLPEEWELEEEPEEWPPELQPKEFQPKMEPKDWVSEEETKELPLGFEQEVNHSEEEPEEWPAKKPDVEPNEWTADDSGNEPAEWPTQKQPNVLEDENPDVEPNEWTADDSEKETEEWPTGRQPNVLEDEKPDVEPNEWTADDSENKPEERPAERPPNVLEYELEEPDEWPANVPAKILEDELEESEEWPAKAPVKVLEDELEEPKEWPANAPFKVLKDELEEPEEWPAERASKILEAETEEPEECLCKAPAGEVSKSNFKTLLGYSHDGTGLRFGYPDDGLIQESVLKSNSKKKADNAGPQSRCSNSNERKRSHCAASDESPILPMNEAMKKLRQEESPKTPTGVDSKVANVQSEPIDLEAVEKEKALDPLKQKGSSGKRRSTECEGEATCKRRKTKWDDNDSQLKMLGPVHLPDLKRPPVVGPELELELIKLQSSIISINCKLQSSELHDDRPENERSPSPEPVYNNLGIRTNTRESRLRMKLIQERQRIISTLIQKNPTFKPPSEVKPPKPYKKLYIPAKEYPDYNFVGLIIGPRGNTQQRMQKETGAKIQVRGKGASRMQRESDNSSNEDLHVYIEADKQESVDAAVTMVEKLLVPFSDGVNEHKQAQFAELAQLTGKSGGKILCNVCGEEDHDHQICPTRFSTPLSSHTCGENSDPAASCSTEALSADTNSLSGSSERVFGSNPVARSTLNSDANIYVANLPQALDDNWLKDLFSPYGKIVSVRVIKDRVTGYSKGYGFVLFESSNDAAMAVIHMNGYKLFGKTLAVRVAGQQSVSRTLIPIVPNHPWSPAAYPDFQGLTTWWYPPQSYHPTTLGSGFSSPATYPGNDRPPPPGTDQPLPPGIDQLLPPGIDQTLPPGIDQLLPPGTDQPLSPGTDQPLSKSEAVGSSLQSSPAWQNQISCVSPAPITYISYYPDYSLQYQTYLTTPVSEPPSAPPFNQLESEGKLTPSPVTDLQFHDPALRTNKSYGFQNQSPLAALAFEPSSTLESKSSEN